MPLEITAEQLRPLIFPDINGGGRTISMRCNICGDTAYHGEDTDAPNNPWLEELIEHIVTKHPGEL